MTDHARKILAAIVPGRRDNLLTALQHLEPDHFREEPLRNIFQMLERYYNLANDIMPRETLSDLLGRSGADVARTLLYEEIYDEVESTRVEDHEFRYAMDALKDMRAEQLTGEAITTGFEILERGAEVDRRELRGHAEAREYLYGELSRIDKLGNAEHAPEGDVRLEHDEMLQDYADRKAGAHAHAGVYTGISNIDITTSGYQPGELILVCAYTGEGKSMLATQIAWHAATQQGKNVFFATSETVRSQVRRRLQARHSRLERFGLPDGLNAGALKNGSLTPDEEEAHREVVRDLTRNPTYGKLYLAQIPRGGTLGFLEARLNRQQAHWNVDLVVIDYLALMRPDRKRTSKREEMDDMLKDTKVMAVTFDGGRGVPVLSPWAMNQTRYTEALRTGEYTLASLAETSEAEKSADQILSLLRLPDQPNEVKCAFLKNRDGETPPPFVLTTDYRCAFLGEKTTGGAVEALLEEEFA